jgi:uncharacterized membrane protein YkoI
MPLAFFITYMLRIAIPLFLLVSICNSSARADSVCITDWSIAAPIVHKEKLTTVEALSRIAADKMAGSAIVRTALCEENGAFFYRIVVRDGRGQLSTLSVDARAPFGK